MPDRKINETKNVKNLLKYIVKKESINLECRAQKIIERDLEGKAIYFEPISKYVTNKNNSPEKLEVAKALHLINTGRNNIVVRPPFTREGMSSLTRELPKNQTISLNFYDANLPGSDFAPLMNNVAQIVSLDLSYSKLLKKDTFKISEHLSKNTTLKILILDGNQVEDEGAIHLSKALQKNHNLEELSLNTTGITKIACFLELFPKGGYEKHLNKKLARLNLEGNCIQNQEEGMKQIRHGIYQNRGKLDSLESIGSFQ